MWYDRCGDFDESTCYNGRQAFSSLCVCISIGFSIPHPCVSHGLGTIFDNHHAANQIQRSVVEDVDTKKKMKKKSGASGQRTRVRHGGLVMKSAEYEKAVLFATYR